MGACHQESVANGSGRVDVNSTVSQTDSWIGVCVCVSVCVSQMPENTLSLCNLCRSSSRHVKILP